MREMIVQVIGAFVAACVLPIIFGIPRKHILADGIVGALGWLCYLLIMQKTTIVMATLFASMIVAFLSNLLARVMKAPVTVFLIPGILSMVPGTSIYRVIYYMIHNDSDSTRYYLMETLQIAGMIVFAILIVETVFRVISNVAAAKLKKEYLS